MSDSSTESVSKELISPLFEDLLLRFYNNYGLSSDVFPTQISFRDEFTESTHLLRHVFPRPQHHLLLHLLL